MMDKDNPAQITVFMLRSLGNFNGKANPNGINNTIFPPIFTIKLGRDIENSIPLIVLNGIKFSSPLLIPIPRDEEGSIVNRMIKSNENRKVH